MEPINTNASTQATRYNARESGSVAPSETSTKLAERPKFVSPKGNIDPSSGVYVVQFRNASTGNVDFQYPNKKVVAEYSRTDQLAPAPSSEGSAQASVVSAPEAISTSSSASSEVASALSAGPTSVVSQGSTAPAALGTTNND